MSSVPALQDSWALLWLMLVRMAGQFVALCFSTVIYVKRRLYFRA